MVGNTALLSESLHPGWRSGSLRAAARCLPLSEFYPEAPRSLRCPMCLTASFPTHPRCELPAVPGGRRRRAGHRDFQLAGDHGGRAGGHGDRPRLHLPPVREQRCVGRHCCAFLAGGLPVFGAMPLATVLSSSAHNRALGPCPRAAAERLLVEYENALVLVTDMKIENVKDIIPLLEQVGARPRERGISRGGGGGSMPRGSVNAAVPPKQQPAGAPAQPAGGRRRRRRRRRACHAHRCLNLRGRCLNPLRCSTLPVF